MDIDKTDYLYYELKTGSIVRRFQVEKSFEIYSGKTAKSDEVGFLRWLHSLLGKSIVKVYTKQQLNPYKLYRKGERVMAITLYAEKYNTTLSEARDELEDYFKNETSKDNLN